MEKKYVIRKVKYNGHDSAESFDMKWDFPFDAYGVYEYRGELAFWIEDFVKLEDALVYLVDKTS